MRRDGKRKHPRLICQKRRGVRGAGGELNLLPNFQKGRDLTGPQRLEVGWWKRGK